MLIGIADQESVKARMPKPVRVRSAARAPSRRAPRRQTPIETVVLAALEEMKAVNVRHYDVRGYSDVADVMIIASGNSDRHVRAIAERTLEKARAGGRRPLGVEGLRDGEWVLVDLQDLVLHVMLPRVREFYAIEQLWEAPLGAGAGASAPPRSSRSKRPRAPAR
jgi:ribosome-associated protein